MSEFEAWLAFRDRERERPIPRVTCTQCGGDATSSDVESPAGSPICFQCDEDNMKPVIGDLGTGMPFRIPGRDTIFMTMGNTWYHSIGGYDGGPWTLDKEAPIEPVECVLHSSSFIGFNGEELEACRKAIYADAEGVRYKEGDKALIEYEYRKRHLEFPKS
jgi:hypothetical protein